MSRVSPLKVIPSIASYALPVPALSVVSSDFDYDVYVANQRARSGEKKVVRVYKAHVGSLAVPRAVILIFKDGKPYGYAVADENGDATVELSEEGEYWVVYGVTRDVFKIAPAQASRSLVIDAQTKQFYSWEYRSGTETRYHVVGGVRIPFEVSYSSEEVDLPNPRLTGSVSVKSAPNGTAYIYIWAYRGQTELGSTVLETDRAGQIPVDILLKSFRRDADVWVYSAVVPPKTAPRRPLDDEGRFTARLVLRIYVQPYAVIGTRVTYIYVTSTPFNRPIVGPIYLYDAVIARYELRGSGEFTVTVDFSARRPVFVSFETGYIETAYGSFVRTDSRTVQVREAYIEVEGVRYPATLVDQGDAFTDIYFGELSLTAEGELSPLMRAVLAPLRIELTYFPQVIGVGPGAAATPEELGWERVRTAFSKWFRAFEAGSTWAYVGFEEHQPGYGSNVIDWSFAEPVLYVEIVEPLKIYIKCVEYDPTKARGGPWGGIKLFYGPYLLAEVPTGRRDLEGKEWVIAPPIDVLKAFPMPNIDFDLGISVLDKLFRVAWIDRFDPYLRYRFSVPPLYLVTARIPRMEIPIVASATKPDDTTKRVSVGYQLDPLVGGSGTVELTV